jgi:uncharacterized protein (DUF3084 family)
MTDIEKREKELASLEEELQSYAREIQERERALQIAEAAKRREDVTRTDYLFDRINRDNRKLTIEVPPVIQIAPQPQQNTQDWITTLMATVAAIAGVATLLAVIL